MIDHFKMRPFRERVIFVELFESDDRPARIRAIADAMRKRPTFHQLCNNAFTSALPMEDLVQRLKDMAEPFLIHHEDVVVVVESCDNGFIRIECICAQRTTDKLEELY